MSCCVRDFRYYGVISLFSALPLFGSVRLRSDWVAARLLHILKVKRKQGGSARRGVWFYELRITRVLASSRQAEVGGIMLAVEKVNPP